MYFNLWTYCKNHFKLKKIICIENNQLKYFKESVNIKFFWIKFTFYSATIIERTY